jgi:hypothetical protein
MPHTPNTPNTKADIAMQAITDCINRAEFHNDQNMVKALEPVLVLLQVMTRDMRTAKMVPEWDNWKDDATGKLYGLGSVATCYASWHMEEHADDGDEGADQLSMLMECMTDTMNILDDMTEPMDGSTEKEIE